MFFDQTHCAWYGILDEVAEAVPPLTIPQGDRQVNFVFTAVSGPGMESGGPIPIAEPNTTKVVNVGRLPQGVWRKKLTEAGFMVSHHASYRHQ